MGIFKIIGTVAGAAIGATVGNPAMGAKIGGTIGSGADALNKKKPKASTGSNTQYIEKPNYLSLNDLKTQGTSASDILSKQKATKVAAAAPVPNIAGGAKSYLEDDPWRRMRDMWEDLGGEPERLGPIDETRMP